MVRFLISFQKGDPHKMIAKHQTIYLVSLISDYIKLAKNKQNVLNQWLIENRHGVPTGSLHCQGIFNGIVLQLLQIRLNNQRLGGQGEEF